jgi:hypothetical protein
LATIATRSSDGYYRPQKSKLLKDFGKTFGKYGQRTLAQHYGDEGCAVDMNIGRCQYITGALAGTLQLM